MGMLRPSSSFSHGDLRPTGRCLTFLGCSSSLSGSSSLSTFFFFFFSDLVTSASAL